MQHWDSFYTVMAVVLLVTLVVSLAVRLYWRLSTPQRRTIIAQYERPAGIDLLESGVLAEKPLSSVQATLVDLAVRRIIRIIREPNGIFLIELLTITGLSSTEERLTHLIFGPRGYQRRVLGRDGARPQRWRRATARLHAAARRSLEARNLVKRRRKNPFHFVAYISAFVVVLTFWGGFGYLGDFGFLWFVPVMVIVSVLVTIANFTLLAGRPVPVTVAGSALRDHLEGVKLYIEVAEADRIRMLQSPSGAQVDNADIVRLYERLLPFAVLYGIEREWTQVLRPYLADELDWWMSGPDDFTYSLSALSFAISTDTDAGGGGDGSEPGDPSDSSSDGFGDGGDFGGDGGDGGGDGGGGDGGGGGD